MQRLLDGLGFAEGPRWHDGRLWFSDFGERVVRAVDLNGGVTEIVRVSNSPSGLGWLPDGSLLVVSMNDQRVLRVGPQGVTEHSDLSRFTKFPCNDMVVDARGNAYVGHMGFDLFARPLQRTAASLIMVTPAAVSMPVGVAYAIWSGLGIVLIAIIGVVLFKETLDLPAYLGMALIIAGVLVLNLVSKAAHH